MWAPNNKENKVSEVVVDEQGVRMWKRFSRQSADPKSSTTFTAPLLTPHDNNIRFAKINSDLLIMLQSWRKYFVRSFGAESYSVSIKAHRDVLISGNQVELSSTF